MQEEIEQKSFNLMISTTKLSARTVLRAIKAALRLYQSKASQGKQSVRTLLRQNRGVSSVEISKTGIRGLERYTDMDELNSIMLGGDAFITKPYNTAILLAKIASLLKKAYPAQQQEQIVYGDAVLHLESSSLGYNGQSIELTKNELKILYYLFKNGGKICSRGDIIEYLWDNQLYVDDNALSVNINRIREKLASIDLTDFIKTKHRQGYTI